MRGMVGLGMSSDEDLARLAVLVKRVSAFAIAAAGAYYFFAYGMSIIGFMFIFLAISFIYNISVGLAVAIGLTVGVAVAVALTLIISGSMWRYLASQGLMRYSSKGWLGFALFLVGFFAVYSVAGMAPEWYPSVAWYLGLGIAFALATLTGKFIERDPYYTLMALSSILLLATTPIVFYLAITQGPDQSNIMASGLILVIYLITGSYAMKKAAKMFEEA